MDIAEKRRDIPGIISGSDLERERRQRRRSALEKTVASSQVEVDYIQEGWELVRRNKNSVRMSKSRSLKTRGSKMMCGPCLQTWASTK